MRFMGFMGFMGFKPLGAARRVPNGWNLMNAAGTTESEPDLEPMNL